MATFVNEARPEDAVATDERIRSDLARLLRERLVSESRLGVWVHPILIAVIVALAWPDAPHNLVLGWGGAVVLTALLRGVWLFICSRQRWTERAVRTGVRVTVTLLAITWGVGGAVVLPIVPFETTALILVVLAGLVASALTTLAADPLSLRGFLAGITLPVFVSLATSDQSHHLAAAIVVALFTLGMAIVARRAHITLVDHLRVTARLAMSEEAAKRTEAVMREARDLAERVARARSAFLANMSHEIRTPMNAVLGFVELILDTELSTEQRRALELVRSSSEALLMILNDILDYSKIEAEHLELESIAFDVSKVVHATASLLAVRAREKHLELLAEVTPEVPRAVRGDPTRLRQVLMNLIGNAIKFTEEGEVVVSVTTALVSDDRVQLRFAVRDTGIGIAPEHIGAVFKEFTQADSTMTRRYGGTGLGLAISQRLVKLMGGQLQVASDVGKGSEFSFTIGFPAEMPTRSSAIAALGGRRMLIVDDNETNRRILHEMLAAEGINVEEVGTASEGLDALRRAAATRRPYDLAILDVQMPDMDGFQLATAVRGEKALKRTKLLMLTSAGQRGDGERCRELGIRGYLTKPISRADLLEGLGTVLAGEPEEAGTPAVVTRHTIAESRRSLRVLLAEDNPVNQQVAVAMLVKRGHEVHLAGNGREAVDAVRDRDYDVVLMDIQMPEMDGFEATQAIRAMPKGTHLPIIGLTAHALSGERERCLSRGMTEYLAKPFKGHELFALVERDFGNAPAPPAPVPVSVAGSIDAKPAAAPPVDLEGFRNTLREAGAESALYSILDTFLRQGPDRLASLAAAVASGTGAEIMKAAHVFRGAAATIGARDLAELLQRVETSARAGEIDDAREAFELVSPAGHAVLEYIRAQQASMPEE
jgi:signal transduction histidine kinase/DNA-binding response OmpR family regulator/HPt (histidine-containing phosphotransfer) domain-containing protein